MLNLCTSHCISEPLFLKSSTCTPGIRNNVHSQSHSWNSSSDARVDSTRTTHVNRYIDIVPGGNTFIRAFIIRYEFTIENNVYFYGVISLHTMHTMHTLEHNFTHVFEELARLDMFRVYHRARQNGFQIPKCFDEAPTESVPGARIYFRAQIPSDSWVMR